MQGVIECIQRAASSVQPMRCVYNLEVRLSSRATGPAHRLRSRPPHGPCKSLLLTLADRLDSVDRAMLFDESDHLRMGGRAPPGQNKPSPS